MIRETRFIRRLVYSVSTMLRSGRRENNCMPVDLSLLACLSSPWLEKRIDRWFIDVQSDYERYVRRDDIHSRKRTNAVFSHISFLVHFTSMASTRKSRTAMDALNNDVGYISTYSQKLDEMLSKSRSSDAGKERHFSLCPSIDGGIRMEGITELCGNPGSGKSNLWFVQ